MMDLSDQEVRLFQFTEVNYTAAFNRYWSVLYAIAYRRLRDSDLAKDMVQEVFVYCWQQRASIQIRTSLEAYLRSALQYQIIAHIRKADIRDRAFTYLYQRMVETEANMQDILTEQDLARTLDGELEQMPDTMREILKLRIRDYSVDEIAQTLNLAKKTVRNNLSKGFSRVRKAVARDFPEDVAAISVVIYVLLT